MRSGRFAEIPEGRADLLELWHGAAPPGADQRPDWLGEAECDRYRYVATVTCSADADWETYRAELDEVELARLIATQDRDDPRRHHLYVERPEAEQCWSIGIYAGASPIRLAPHTSNPVLTAADVTDVVASYVADPFLLSVDGRWHLFFEVLNWHTWKGEIGLAISDDAVHWTYEGIVLSEAFHLSYPYAFTSEGTHWMIPETHQCESVRLYRSPSFPLRWELDRVLLEGAPFTDSSVVRHDGRWWLFTQTTAPGQYDALRLFSADDVQGPWAEHPRSPIVTDDPGLARPGGRVLHIGDQLVRFAQDCRSAYGVAVHAVEITELTADRYDERLLARDVLGPGSGWNAGGMHTIDAHQLGEARWLACVDGWYPAPEAD